MKGELLIIHPSNGIDSMKLMRRLADGWINELVGGLIEPVPQFDQIATLDGRLISGTAYYNQEATLLRMPVNLWATAMWHYIVRSKGETRRPQVLQGPVVFLSGDDEFMEGL